MNNDRTKQCSVLCRFEVKDGEKLVPKLNDLVEVIGPIDDSSVEALDVFSQQQSIDDVPLDDAIHFPPPSRLPRMNVEEHRVIDIDDLELEEAHKHFKKFPGDLNLKFETNANLDNDEYDRTTCIQAFCQYLFHNNTIAAEAFLMCMLSTAERRNSKTIKAQMAPRLAVLPSISY